jgi:hypothetical protein
MRAMIQEGELEALLTEQLVPPVFELGPPAFLPTFRA